MKIKLFRNFKQSKEPTILTIGNFDGMHLGHQKILQNVSKISQNRKLKRILLTFEPHPCKIINPHKPYPKKIIPLKEKINFLQQNNLIDEIYLIKFNKKLQNITAKEFVTDILVKKLNIKAILVGYDFTFGKNKQGNFDLLQKLGNKFDFTAQKIPEITLNNKIISSSTIRNYLSKGKVDKCPEMLGRNYYICGKVSEGKKLGQKLGFPTANIIVDSKLQRLKYGVYEVIAHTEGQPLKAIANYGIKPTFGNNICICEVHIFNFNKNIYSKNIKVEFIRFIRAEKKFSSLQELKEAIKQDCSLVLIPSCNQNISYSKYF